MYNIKSRIVSNTQIKPNIFEMVFQAPEIATKAKPGQFIEIDVNDDSVLLRRPMSVLDADPETGEVKIWYHVVGKGTTALSRVKPGDELEIMGPLGNSFYLRSEARTVVMVGGGMGVPPLVFLNKVLAKTNPEIKRYAIIGARTQEILLGENEFKEHNAEVLIATDDGSKGFKGFPTNVLTDLINRVAIDQAVTCGPEAMMFGIAKISRDRKVFCLVSMEAPMACGIGACHGCAIETKIGYRRVCKEGPIFKGEDVLVD